MFKKGNLATKMDFDRSVSLLQGAFLGHSETLVEQVFEIFSSSDSDQRKLFLCILLNTDHIEWEELTEDQQSTYEPFLNLFYRQVEITEIKQIISRCKLWTLFLQCLPFFTFSSEFLEDLASTFFAENDFVRKLAFLAGLVKRGRLNQKSAAALDLFLAKYVLKFQDATIGERILALLFLIKIGETTDFNELIYKSSMSKKDEIIEYYMDQSGLDLLELQSSAMKVLFDQLVFLVKSINFDFWISLVEFETRPLLENNVLCFWTRDLYPPSNLQLLISHYCFEVSQQLSLVENSHPWKDALEVIKRLGKEYDRKMELHLEDLSTKELLENAKLEMTNEDDWKLECYIQQLATTLESDNQDPEIWDLLKQNSKYLSSFGQKFYQIAISSEPHDELRDEKLALLGSVFLHGTSFEALKIFNDHFEKFEFSGILKTRSFQEDCRVLLNRSTLKQYSAESKLELEMIWLCLQSPLEFFHFMIDACSQDVGKIEVVVAVSKMFQQMKKVSVFDHLVVRLADSLSSPKTLANVSKLIQLLNQSWTEEKQFTLQSDLCLSLFKAVWSSIESNQSSQNVQPIFKAILNIVQTIGIPFSKVNSVLLSLGFCKLLNQNYMKESWNTEGTQNLETMLEILAALIFNSQDAGLVVKKVLNRNLCQYLLQSTETKESDFVLMLRQSSFAKLPFYLEIKDDQGRHQLVLQIATGMARYLPRDFQSLGANLKISSSGENEAETFAKPAVTEILLASELFFKFSNGLSQSHLEYVANSIGLTVASALENTGTVSKEQMISWFSLTNRFIHLLTSYPQDLTHTMEMFLINLVNQISQDETFSESDVINLVSNLYPVNLKDSKSLCLAKLKLHLDLIS